MYVCSQVMMQWSVMYCRWSLCYACAYLCGYGWSMIDHGIDIVRAPLLQRTYMHVPEHT